MTITQKQTTELTSDIISITQTRNVELSYEAISILICTAIEGGSNYWYRIFGYVEPLECKFRCDIFKDDEEPHRIYDYPLNEGGAVIIGDAEAGAGEAKRLQLSTIKRGLTLMAEKYPNHFQRVVDETYDADDADVFLQLSLFNEVVFG